jgi:hypothetical protein
MGNDHSTSYSIQRQENYVRDQMKTINQSQNYVSSRRYTSSGRENKYSSDQIEGKLRQEYYGISKPNSYVLSQDWSRMRRH